MPDMTIHSGASSSGHALDRWPSVFGVDPPSPAFPEVSITNSTTDAIVAASSSFATAKMLAGIWCRLTACNAFLDPLIGDTYPSVLVPRPTCGTVVEEKCSGETDITDRPASHCIWASTHRGCWWNSTGHSPHCPDRHVDWDMYFRGVLAWVDRNQSDTDAIRRALSPNVIIARKLSSAMNSLGTGHHVNKQVGHDVWRGCLLHVHCIMYAKKLTIAAAIQDSTAEGAEVIMIVNDGPAETAAYHTNNVGMFNTLSGHTVELERTGQAAVDFHRICGSMGTFSDIQQSGGGGPAPTRPVEIDHHGERIVTVEIWPPYLLGINFQRSVFYCKPLLLSRIDALELERLGYALDKLPEISRHDPMLKYHCVPWPRNISGDGVDAPRVCDCIIAVRRPQDMGAVAHYQMVDTPPQLTKGLMVSPPSTPAFEIEFERATTRFI